MRAIATTQTAIISNIKKFANIFKIIILNKDNPPPRKRGGVRGGVLS